MPYRRLPNTDKARIRALKIALDKGKELPPFKLAYSQRSYHQLQSFFGNFENAMLFYQQCLKIQTAKNREYTKTLKRARMYISHFMQVMNLAILRGDMKPDIRQFYNIEAGESNIPSLASEKILIEFGERLIKGEEQRIMRGHTPITNPSAALVKVRYETFIEAYHHQKTLQKNSTRALEKLTDLRSEADKLIVTIWNEVEHHFNALSPEKMREQAKEYGLIYIFRKSELEVKPDSGEVQEIDLKLHQEEEGCKQLLIDKPTEKSGQYSLPGFSLR